MTGGTCFMSSASISVSALLELNVVLTLVPMLAAARLFRACNLATAASAAEAHCFVGYQLLSDHLWPITHLPVDVSLQAATFCRGVAAPEFAVAKAAIRAASAGEMHLRGDRRALRLEACPLVLLLGSAAWCAFMGRKGFGHAR